MDRKTVSVMKACEVVGVSRRTIYNWLSSGKIAYIRTAGGSVRVFVDTLWRDPQCSDRPPVRPSMPTDVRQCSSCGRTLLAHPQTALAPVAPSPRVPR